MLGQDGTYGRTPLGTEALPVAELVAMQKLFGELERSHQRIRGQYEEEMARLRRELEGRNGGSVSGGSAGGSGLPGLPSMQTGSASAGPPVPGAEESGNGAKRSTEEPPRGREETQRRRNSTAAEETAGRNGTGYDWLVIYNPKATRTISIDLVHTLPHEGVVCCVRFSADGRRLATGGNRCCQVWDVASGESRGVFRDDQVREDGAGNNEDLYMRACCFSVDGKHLIAGAEDAVLRVWDVQTGQLVRRLAGHVGDIYAVSVHGGLVASGSGDRTVRLWEGNGGEPRIFTASNDEDGDAGITSLSLSPDGRWLLAGCLDRVIRIWDTGSGRLVETVAGHRDSVYSVALSRDGKTLVSGSLDRTLRIWSFSSTADTVTVQPRCTVAAHKDFVLSVAVAADPRWIISGSKDRSVQFWDAETGLTQLMLQGHKNSVISVAASPGEGLFATGSGDGRARIWSFQALAAK